MSSMTSPGSVPVASLHLTYGTMAAGKSTLALQLAWQLRAAGTNVALWSFGDRSGEALVTSRIGISAPAVAVGGHDELEAALADLLSADVRVLVVDEAQFATAAQIDRLADLVDTHAVTVHCFALASDFRTEVFPGTARLFALADNVSELPLATYCWCGARGRCNARIQDGTMVRDGAQLVLGDTAEDDEKVRYQVLCRRHYRLGQFSA